LHPSNRTVECPRASDGAPQFGRSLLVGNKQSSTSTTHSPDCRTVTHLNLASLQQVIEAAHPIPPIPVRLEHYGMPPVIGLHTVVVG
jgi:hypothetical protein